MTDFIGVFTVFLLMGGAREFRVLDLHGGGALVLVLGLGISCLLIANSRR